MSHHAFFCNKDCEYYPCHTTDSPLNCLFCFCPLYAFENCGGHFTYTDKGVKDCSNCLLPHREGGYDFLIKRLAND